MVSVPVGNTVVLLAVLELPASIASAQPSPSESKSNELIMPSPSVSQPTIDSTLTLSILISSLVALKLKAIVLVLAKTNLGTETIILAVGALCAVILILDTLTVAPFTPTTDAVVPPFGLLIVA